MLWGEHDDDLGRCEEPPQASPGSAPWYNSETGTKLHWRVWEAWGAAQAVIDIARYGVDWLTDGAVPPAFDGDNYTSVREERWRDIIAKCFKDFEDNKMVEYFDEWITTNVNGVMLDFVFIINSIGIVPKKDDPTEGRPVFDFTRSGVNAFMLALPFDLPSPATFLRQAWPGYVIYKKDIRHGFYNLTLRDNGAGEDGPRRWAGFRHPITGRLGRFCAPAMGARQAPYFFCMVTREALDIFKRHAQHIIDHLQHGVPLPAHAPLPPRIAAMLEEGVHVCDLIRDLRHTFVDVYVDDFVMVGPPLGVRVMNVILEDTGNTLGLEYKLSKDQCGAELDVLGAVIRIPPAGGCARDSTMELGEDKMKSYGEQLDVVLAAARAGATTSGGDYDRLVGKLAYAAGISRFLRERMLPLYRCTGATGSGTKRQRRARVVHVYEQDVRAALEWWRLALQGQEGRISRGKWDVVDEEEAWIYHHFVQRQEASAWGWGGRAGASGELECVHPWTAAEQDMHITMRRLLAAVTLFEKAALIYAGECVVIETSDAGVAGIINSGGSHSAEGGMMVRRLAAVCDAYGISVRARWVSHEDMGDDCVASMCRPGKGELPRTEAARATWLAAVGQAAALLTAKEDAPGVDEDHKFAPFNNYNQGIHKHTMDTCCDEYGYNAQPGCIHPFHGGRSVVAHWREMVGHTLWVNPPFSMAGAVIRAVVRASSPQTPTAPCR